MVVAVDIAVDAAMRRIFLDEGRDGDNNIQLRLPTILFVGVWFLVLWFVCLWFVVCGHVSHATCHVPRGYCSSKALKPPENSLS